MLTWLLCCRWETPFGLPRKYAQPDNQGQPQDAQKNRAVEEQPAKHSGA